VNFFILAPNCGTRANVLNLASKRFFTFSAFFCGSKPWVEPMMSDFNPFLKTVLERRAFGFSAPLLGLG
jgi:hypothetical protein